MKLNTHAQFNPSKQSVASILARYSLVLKDFKAATSGIENCTLLVTADTGSYVLRVYRQHKRDQQAIQLEIAFVQYLDAHDIPVAAPIANGDGSYVTQFDEGGRTWAAIVMPLMPGEHAEGYTDELINELADVQARMHLLGASFKQAQTPPEAASELRERQFISQIRDRQALDADRAGFVDRAEAYRVQLANTLPRGFCHLDYDNGNVLTEYDTITAVLDFDDLEYAPFVQCLAYTVWDVVFDKGITGIETYLETYEQRRELTDEEHALLVPIVLFRHYVIGCMDIAHDQMDDTSLARYLSLEKELINLAEPAPQKAASPDPLVTFVMPTYNRAGIIANAIQSIIDQTNNNWELLVVDDGSTDNTKEVVEGFNDTRIRYIYQLNRGPAAARNTGLAQASGTWVAYLDSDNELFPKYLAIMLEYLEKHPQAVFAIPRAKRTMELWEDGKLVKSIDDSQDTPPSLTLRDIFLKKLHFDTNGFIHLRRLYDEGIRWDETLIAMEDWDIAMCIGEQYPEGFLYVPEVLYHYHQRYGGDGVVSNSLYGDWAVVMEQIYQKHKDAELMQGQDWYPAKVDKWNRLQREYDEGKLPPYYLYYFRD